MDIGVLCNNAALARDDDGVHIGQSTDVALLHVLNLFGLPDRRAVSDPRFILRTFIMMN